MLDGENIKKLNPAWYLFVSVKFIMFMVGRYRRQIGYVSQEPVLFATTIKENIKFGNENVTDEQIEEAAKLANALEFVKSFEQVNFDYKKGRMQLTLISGI